MSVFEKVKFDKLEKLNIGSNKINDITPLAKINLKELKILILNNNPIYNIDILEKINFKSNFNKLKKLSIVNHRAFFRNGAKLYRLLADKGIHFEYN